MPLRLKFSLRKLKNKVNSTAKKVRLATRKKTKT